MVPEGLDGDGRRAWLLEHLVAQATRCDAGFCLALEVAYGTLLAERTEAFVTVLAKRNVPWKPVAPPGELTRVASFLGHHCRRREVQGLPRRDPELARRLAAVAQPEWSDEAWIVEELDRMCAQWDGWGSWILETELTFRTLVRREHALDVEISLRSVEMRELVPALTSHLIEGTPAMQRVAAACVLAARGHQVEEMRDRLIAQMQRYGDPGNLIALECLGELARRGDASLIPVLVSEGAGCDAGFCTSSMGILEGLMRQHTEELVAAVAPLESPEVNMVLTLIGEACWLREPEQGHRLAPDTRDALRSIQSAGAPERARTAAALERACTTWAPPRR